MGLDVARLKGSELVVNETPEVCWAALMLWCAAWHEVPAGSVPNNERWLADKAGYLSRGQIDLSWGQLRDGILRGFVECSDGRLYHAVTCEIVMEAWASKLRHRWVVECARVRKHNQRHGTSVTTLDFDDWMRAGCPVGAPLEVPASVPSESRESHAGRHAAVPRETASKRREEKGILSISPTTVGETRESASPPAVPPSDGFTEAPAASTPARKRAAPAPGLPCPEDVTRDVWDAWLELRRKKRAPVSDVVLQQARKEAGLAKLSLEQFLRVWCFRGSQGLHADWITPQDRQRFGSAQASDRVGRQLRTAALMVNPPEAPGSRTPAEPVQEVIDVTTRRIA
jgi:hypothetical protein